MCHRSEPEGRGAEESVCVTAESKNPLLQAVFMDFCIATVKALNSCEDSFKCKKSTEMLCSLDENRLQGIFFSLEENRRKQ